MRRNLSANFLLKALQEPDLAKFQVPPKTQARFGIPPPACLSGALPFALPGGRKNNENVRKNNDTFALYRDFYRIIYHATRLTQTCGDALVLMQCLAQGLPNPLPNPPAATCHHERYHCYQNALPTTICSALDAC